MSPDHTFHDETLCDFPSLATKKDTDSFLDLWYDAFPDVQITIHAEVVQGDMVVHRWTATGTYNGDPIAETEPNGYQITIPGITISHVSNDKVQETWNVFDSLYFYYEIGGFPERLKWPLFGKKK
jgi:predicted ester cyclase